MSKSYVFHGTRDYSAKAVQEMLGIGRVHPQQQQQQNLQQRPGLQPTLPLNK